VIWLSRRSLAHRSGAAKSESARADGNLARSVPGRALYYAYRTAVGTLSLTAQLSRRLAPAVVFLFFPTSFSMSAEATLRIRRRRYEIIQRSSLHPPLLNLQLSHCEYVYRRENHYLGREKNPESRERLKHILNLWVVLSSLRYVKIIIVSLDESHRRPIIFFFPTSVLS